MSQKIMPGALFVGVVWQCGNGVLPCCLAWILTIWGDDVIVIEWVSFPKEGVA